MVIWHRAFPQVPAGLSQLAVRRLGARWGRPMNPLAKTSTGLVTKVGSEHPGVAPSAPTTSSFGHTRL